MCFALDCKCSGVSTLESLAYGNVIFEQGLICSVMKARQNLVYTCTYKSDGYRLDNICEEKIVSRDELAEYLAFQGKKVLLCGDGSADFFNDYRSENFILAPPHSRLQNSCGVCLASVNKDFITPEELEVSYLQKVKAEKDLEEKTNGG